MSSLPPRDAAAVGQIFDLRTRAERLLLGRPPGSVKVSLLRSGLRPEPAGVYLCQHAVRSKLPVRRGAREVAGGFAAWRAQGLPVEGGLLRRRRT